jgi:hypothetical protein
MLVPLYLTYRCLLLPASPSSFSVELFRKGRRKGNNQFPFLMLHHLPCEDFAGDSVLLLL